MEYELGRRTWYGMDDRKHNYHRSRKYNRSIYEMVINILEALKEPKTASRLHFVVEESEWQAKNHVCLLVKNGLVSRDGNLYRITDKGIEYINKYKKVVEDMKLLYVR